MENSHYALTDVIIIIYGERIHHECEKIAVCVPSKLSHESHKCANVYRARIFSECRTWYRYASDVCVLCDREKKKAQTHENDYRREFEIISMNFRSDLEKNATGTLTNAYGISRKC